MMVTPAVLARPGVAVATGRPRHPHHGPSLDRSGRVNPYFVNPGIQGLQTTGLISVSQAPPTLTTSGAPASLLALLASIRDPAMNLERIARVQPARHLAMAPDRIEPAAAGNPIWQAARGAAQGHLSTVDHESAIVIEHLQHVAVALVPHDDVPEQVPALRLLPDLDPGIGQQREVVAVAGHRARHELHSRVVREALAHGRRMVVVPQRLQVAERRPREDRLEISIVAEQYPLDVGDRVRVDGAEPAIAGDEVTAQVAGGQAGNLRQVLVPDVVLRNIRGHAFDIAGETASLAASARLKRPVANRQRDDVALAGPVGVAPAIEVPLENGRPHRVVQLPGPVERLARPARGVLGTESTPALLQRGAASPQFAIGIGALHRIVESANDLVTFAGRLGVGRPGRRVSATGGSNLGGLSSAKRLRVSRT